MPFTDVVRCVTFGLERGGNRGCAGTQAKTIFPDAGLRRILPGEERRTRGAAERLVRYSVLKSDAAARDAIEIGRDAHRIQAIGPDEIPAELIGNDQEEIGLGFLAGLRRWFTGCGFACSQCGQSYCCSGILEKFATACLWARAGCGRFSVHKPTLRGEHNTICRTRPFPYEKMSKRSPN